MGKDHCSRKYHLAKYLLDHKCTRYKICPIIYLHSIEPISDFLDLLTLGANDLLVEPVLNDQILGALILLQNEQQFTLHYSYAR